MDFEPSILSALAVWSDFNVDLPLKESITNQIQYDNVVMSDVHFSGREVVADQRVRVYGTLAEPENANGDAILIIPDVDDTGVSEFVTHYAKLGYTVLAVNYYGKKQGANDYTVYPEQINYANYEQAGQYLTYAYEGAKKTCWYEWTAVCLYALQFLKKCKNATKIGVFGIKTGSNIAWQVCANSEAVSAFVGAFGAGWIANKGYYKNNGEDIELNDERHRFIAGVEAQSYAPYVKCPILFLTSTNNADYDVDREIDTVSRATAKNVYMNITARISEYLSGSSYKDMDLFFEKYVHGNLVKIPEPPELSITQSRGNIIIKADFDYKSASLFDSYKVYVSEGINNPSRRFWTKLDDAEVADGISCENTYKLSGGEYVDVFVVAKYTNGFTISSKIVSKKIQSDEKVIEHLVLNGSNGLGRFIKLGKGNNDVVGNLFYVSDTRAEVVVGPHNIKGVRGAFDGILSYVIGKNSFVLKEDSLLKFDIYTKDFCKLTVVFSADNNQGENFEYTFKVNGGDTWQNIVIELSDFKSEQNMSIKNFDGIYAISFKSNGEFLINNVLVL